MDSKMLREFLGKPIRIVCKDSYIYHGIILKISEDALRLRDKFGKQQIIRLDAIDKLGEWEQ